MQELTNEPHLFVGGASRLDIQQGQLGKYICLFICSIINPAVTLQDKRTGSQIKSCRLPHGTKSVVRQLILTTKLARSILTQSTF